MRRYVVWCLAGIATCASCAVPARAPRPRAETNAIFLGDTRFGLVAALKELVAALPSDSAPACLTIRGPAPAYFYSPDSLLLDELRTPSRRIVTQRACPPTYDLMSVLVDSSGRSITPARPPGYVDPHVVVVDGYDAVGSDSATFKAVAHQGTLNRHFACTAHREAQRVWNAHCVFLGTTMSAVPPEAGETLQLMRASIQAYDDPPPNASPSPWSISHSVSSQN